MSWLTLPKEPRITLELSLSELRHFINALISLNQEPDLELEAVEMNDQMIGLLLQLEGTLIDEMNQDEDEEHNVRKFGEA